MTTYELMDSGGGKKLERFGKHILIRPCGQAIWKPSNDKFWERADAEFIRSEKMQWIERRKKLSNKWITELDGIKFSLFPTSFGHLGLFPEHSMFWSWMKEKLKQSKNPSILNLFAYTGATTPLCAKYGAKVCHLDASKGLVGLAKENALLNSLEDAPIRWIVDDVSKFLSKEKRREKKYDAIILDPPSFGRGKNGQVFKIDTLINDIVIKCVQLLSDKPLFFLMTCHTPGYTPKVLQNTLSQYLNKFEGEISSGEILLNGSNKTLSIPMGAYVKWSN